MKTKVNSRMWKGLDFAAAGSLSMIEILGLDLGIQGTQ
jgi:hypothetical protein